MYCNYIDFTNYESDSRESRILPHVPICAVKSGRLSAFAYIGG